MRRVFSFRRKQPPSLPTGVRIYAVGDVHGRADLLEGVFARIDADLATHPAEQPLEVYLGDYVDRGPASFGVLERLIARWRSRKIVCLKGNHEALLWEFMRDPSLLASWRQWGGLETLLSYGLTPPLNPGKAEQAELARLLRQVMPPAHRRFLENLKLSFACGGFLFVHAGVRPGVSLEEQTEADLLWIREDFLSHEEDFGKIVVHGHTPVIQADIRRNRINIDTGAYITGRLTCLAIEGSAVRLI
jgi:serine/threonine protein phosphatase 1